MQRRSPWRLVVLLVVVMSMMVVSLPHASAQSTESDAQTRAQLAAIPLTTGDLPDGYVLVGESFATAEEGVIAGVGEQTLVDAGFQGMYISVYGTAGEPGNITSYASIWSDGDAAENGFALLEDEAAINPGAGLSDEEIDAGTGTAELTSGTVEQDGTAYEIRDATFVVDRFVTGVSVTTSGDGSRLDEASVDSLVETLEARATAVANGEGPDGIDLSLPGMVLDLQPLGTPIQSGFLSADESETLYGVSGSSLSGIQTSWVSAVAAGEGATAPYVVIAASRFENADNAARVVEQSADLVPLSIVLQPLEGFTVEGVDAVRGYQYASTSATGGAPDSFRAVAQIGDMVIVVDVQAASSVDAAQAAAAELLAAQVQCDGGGCQAPEIGLGQ